MQDIISTLKNALLQAEAGLEVAVVRLTKDGTERGDFKPSEVLALASVREALAMPVPLCQLQIQEPAEYPHLPSSTADVVDFFNGRLEVDFGDPAPAGGTKLYSAAQMRSYVDADRAQRAALVQAEQVAPKLDDAWKARMLDGQPLELDKHGFGFHPSLPNFDECVNGPDFFAVFGIELKASMAEDEMDSDAYEAMTDPNAVLYDCRAWTPNRPDGDGWNLVAIFDTEDGPACWWVRDKPFVPQRQEGRQERVDNAAVEVLSMNMKAKLAGQRAKGYRGWNNDCTQQRLSELLRQCVDKGDPVDVANFCAFLLARGETIAPPAASPASEQDAQTFEQRMSDWQHADALDAARYRYLTQTMGDYCVTDAHENTSGVYKAGAADTVIDAAIAAQAAKGKQWGSTARKKLKTQP